MARASGDVEMEIVESTFRNLHNRAKVFDENLESVIQKQKRIEGDFYTTIDLVREIREKASQLNEKLHRIEKGFNLELYMNRPVLKNVYNNIPKIRISDDDDDYYNSDFSDVEEKKPVEFKPSSKVVIKSSTSTNVVSSPQKVRVKADSKEDEEDVSKPELNGYSSDDDYDPVKEKMLREEERKKREEQLRQEEEEEERRWEEEERQWEEQKKLKKEREAEEEEGDDTQQGERSEDNNEVNDVPKNEVSLEQSNGVDQEINEETDLQIINDKSSERVTISVKSSSMKSGENDSDEEKNSEKISLSVNTNGDEGLRVQENGSNDLSEEELKLKEIALTRAEEDIGEDEEEERRILEKIERMKQEELLLMQQEA